MIVSDTLARIFFAVRKAVQLRPLLVSWNHSPLHTIDCLPQLTPDRLKTLHTTLLVLDFDGVLAAHGDLEPCQEALEWLDKIIKTCPTLKIAILSNKPLFARQLFFSTHFPQIIFLVTAFKKPYPMGLQQLAVQSGTPVSQMLLVDDRWLTGMLAAALAGVEGLYVQKPYANFRRRPVVETFFAGLRIIERLFV